MRESTKATRATILQSAKEIFLECGYQEASMRKIAARAGITPSRTISCGNRDCKLCKNASGTGNRSQIRQPDHTCKTVWKTGFCKLKEDGCGT